MQPVGADSAAGAGEERVSQRAYERFQARGGDDGHDQEDWFEAERDLLDGVGE